MFRRRLIKLQAGLLVLLLLFLAKGKAVAGQIRPGEVQLILKGHQACKRGDYEAGILAYQSALAVYDSAHAAFNLGVTFEVNMRDRVQAIYYYQKFLELEADSEDSPHVRQWLKELQLYLDNQPVAPPEQPPPAAETEPAKSKPRPRSLDQLDAESAKVARQHLKEGNLAYIRGDYQQAIEHYRKVLQIFESPDVYYNLGLIYAQKLQQNKQALVCYQRFLELEPNSPHAEKIKAWIKQARQAK